MSPEIKVFSGEEFFRPGESVYIQRSEQFPSFVGVMHKHHFIEIVYVLQGEAEHIVGENHYPVKRGDVIIINFDTPHMFRSLGDGFSAYDFMFKPDFFDVADIGGANFESLSTSFLFYSLFPDETPLGSDLQLSPSASVEFAALFDKIYNEYRTRDKGYIDLIRAYGIELIIKLFRHLDKDRSRSISEKQRQLVLRAVEYLKDNFDSPVSIGDLAARTFLSKDYFGHLFKDTTGVSVSTFIQKLRVEEACRLLTATQRTVTDIALACGFSDMKFFYSCFKKLTGTTPARYRNSSEEGKN